MSRAKQFCRSRLPLLTVLLLAGCAGGGGGVAPAASLLTGSANNNSVSGSPRLIYERIALRAAKCWFGPFGSARQSYMTSADVPPPSSSAPVVIYVHRRLPASKSPLGAKLMRVELTGSSSTTLDFINSGLDTRSYGRVVEAVTAWANDRADCRPLLSADGRWAPQRGAEGAGSALQQR